MLELEYGFDAVSTHPNSLISPRRGTIPGEVMVLCWRRWLYEPVPVHQPEWLAHGGDVLNAPVMECLGICISNVLQRPIWLILHTLANLLRMATSGPEV